MNVRFFDMAPLLLCLLGSPASATGAPPALIKAVQNLRPGSDFLVLDRENRQELRYPGTDQVTDTLSSRLVAGGKILAVRVQRSREGNQEKTAADLAAMQANAAKQLPQAELSYVVPAGLATLGDFTYGAESRSGNMLAIALHSIRRDDRHADGTVYIDATSNRLVENDYVPNVFPKPANDGSGTMTFAKVLPSIWELAREEMHFPGRQFLIKGTADIVITHSHYRKFGSRTAAEKAL